MQTSARVLLDVASGLITLGGLYDIFVPALPPHLAALCGTDEKPRKLARELLRALGGCLVAVGLTVALLVNGSLIPDDRTTSEIVLLLVLPSEGLNALGMYRAGSPWVIPLGFIAITLAGVLLA